MVAPELLPAIQEALVTAERVAELRAQANRYEHKIEQLKSELAGTSDPADEPMSAGDVKWVFGQLQQQVDQQLPTMDPVRRESVRDVMQTLTDLVGVAGTDRSLRDMAVERVTLDRLLEQMSALRQDTDE